MENPTPEGPGKVRPVYPYSVIPGGAYTAAELDLARRRDSAVSAHFARFQSDKVHIRRLGAEGWAYVSFRKGRRIFWTKKPVRIPAGETLIGDGVSYARARCGNRISETPQLPTTPAEPPVEVLNPPELAVPPVAARRALPSGVRLADKSTHAQPVSASRQSAPPGSAGTSGSSEDTKPLWWGDAPGFAVPASPVVAPLLAEAGSMVDQPAIVPVQFNEDLFSQMPAVSVAVLPEFPYAAGEIGASTLSPASTETPATQIPSFGSLAWILQVTGSARAGGASPASRSPGIGPVEAMETGLESGLPLESPPEVSGEEAAVQPAVPIPGSPGTHPSVSVPEPVGATLATLGIAFLILAARIRRRR